MHKARGFTLIELIFTLLITAILAGVIVEVIAGPIKSYFWVSQRASHVEDAQNAIDVLERELDKAVITTINISSQPNPTLSFNKILYEGFAVIESSAKDMVILSAIAANLEENKTYLVNFPSYDDATYQATLEKAQDKWNLHLSQDMTFSLHQPQRFYIVSQPIYYACDAKTTNLNRTEGAQEALIANQIRHCQFSKINENNMAAVLVSIEMDAKQKEPIKMSRTFSLGEGK